MQISIFLLSVPETKAIVSISKNMPIHAYPKAMEFLENANDIINRNNIDDPQEIEIIEKLKFDVKSLLCEIYYLVGEYSKASEILDFEIPDSIETLDKVKLYEKQMLIVAVVDETDNVIKLAEKALNLLGFKIPESKNKLNILKELLKIKVKLLGKDTDFILNLPKLKSEKDLEIAKILMELSVTLYLISPEYFALIILKLMDFSLKKGNSIYSPYAYAFYGVLLTSYVGETEKGYNIAAAALKLHKDSNSLEVRSKLYFLYGTMVLHWKEPIHKCYRVLKQAYVSGIESGDTRFASFSITYYVILRALSDSSIENAENRMFKYLSSTEELHHPIITNFYKMWLQIIRSLRTADADPEIISGQIFDEKKAVVKWTKKSTQTQMATYYVAKQFYLFMNEKYSDVILYHQKAEKIIKNIQGTYFIVMHYYFSALSVFMQYKSNAKISTSHSKITKKAIKLFNEWSRSNPKNFNHQYLLLISEDARIKGDIGTAVKLFGKASTAASENGSILDISIINESTYRFYDQVSPITAKYYFMECFNQYNKLGIKLKTEKMQKINSLYVKTSNITCDNSISSTINNSALDMHSIIKSTVAISKEIEPEPLIKRLMKIIFENTGADRGFLIFEKDGELVIEAYADISINRTEIFTSIPLDGKWAISKSAVQYTFRTSSTLLYPEDKNILKNDSYINQYNPKSLLATPIKVKDKVMGVLYLENTLSADVFSHDRIKVLSVILTQSAISLENAMLFSNLEKLVEKRTIELKDTHKKLVNTARMAGRAEFASGVLHNIGNILNSVNVSAESALTKLDGIKIDTLSKISKVLNENDEHLIDYLTNNPQGKKLPIFLETLSDHFTSEQQRLHIVLQELKDHITHMNEVLSLQESYSRKDFYSENISLTEIVNDAIYINESVMNDHGITINFSPVTIKSRSYDRHKIMQIAVNILLNAKDSLIISKKENKMITITINEEKNNVKLNITDNGIGISKENIKQIFNYGFTTKKGKLGYGLHNSANLAISMGGSVQAYSDGEKCGATFSLILPGNKEGLYEA